MLTRFSNMHEDQKVCRAHSMSSQALSTRTVADEQHGNNFRTKKKASLKM